MLALQANHELHFLSGRIRVKNSDISSNLKATPISESMSTESRQQVESYDPADTLVAFDKSGPYAAVKASGNDFFERKNQLVGLNKVTIDPRMGTLTSAALFVNETSDDFVFSLIEMSKDELELAKDKKENSLESQGEIDQKNCAIFKKLSAIVGRQDEDSPRTSSNYDPHDPNHCYVWESERHFPPFGWKSPQDILNACFTARFSPNIDGSNSTKHFPESDGFLLPKGHQWAGEWELDRPPGKAVVSKTGAWAYDAYWVTSWPPKENANSKNMRRFFAYLAPACLDTAHPDFGDTQGKSFLIPVTTQESKFNPNPNSTKKSNSQKIYLSI